MMQRSQKEKEAAREQFRQLPFRQKAEHIFIYYKWFILLGLALLVILGTTLHRVLTKKDRVLFLALTNVSIGSELERELGEGFVEALGLDPAQTEVLLYQGLYLSENAEGEAHRAAYASRVKLMASVEGQELDAVLMSGQAYELLSAHGYLLDLNELLADEPELAASAAPYLTEGEVVLEDNQLDVQWKLAEQRVVRSERAVNALRLTDLPRYAPPIFPEPVYLGFLVNTPRQAACLDYLRYILQAGQP